MELCFYSYNPAVNVHVVWVFESEAKEMDPLKAFKKAREKFQFEFADCEMRDTDVLMRAMLPGAQFVPMLQDGERVFGISKGWTKALQKRIETANCPVRIRRTFIKSPAPKKSKG